MILWPAVDILDGKAVRLERGRFGSETVYDLDPLEAAKRWLAEGARALHVVDLDGARSGSPVNLKQVERIASSANVPVQVGGGLRSAAAVTKALQSGADRVVIGTVAYTDPALLKALLAEHGERVTVSLDARQGRVAGAGWLDQTEVSPEHLAKQLSELGLRHLIYSSIDRDGTLAGPDLEGIARIAAATAACLSYSGGIASLQDLEALARSDHDNLDGVIVGKALYERRFTVAEGQAVLDG
jgi:phosphoribosylformimino-5-aminoimidazole carboxamide ribotide isomerase